ncbi:hypothetical protein HNO89_000274 [Sporosarcina luteola]|nr:hypothetical protein [Sporosarcina luteola]
MYSAESNDGFVYFFHVQTGEPIKRGSATDSQERINQIKPGNHKKLNLLHVTTDGKRLEFNLHERLSDDKMFGKWFK